MFGNTNFNYRKGFKSQQRRNRTMQMEALEERDLLSVSPLGDCQDLAAVYSSFPISEDANIIDVTELTVDNLQAAIDQAAQTPTDDVVVIHTTSDSNTVQLNGAALTFDINSDLYGSIALVGYGDSMLTLSNTQENVALVNSGEVYFYGISFLVQQPEEQNLLTDNLIAVSEGAKADFSRSMFAVEDALYINGSIDFASQDASDTYVNNLALSSSSVYTHTYKVNVNFSGTKWAYVTGVSYSDYNKLQNWAYTGTIDGNFIDAEKYYNDPDDDDLCWAATASNMLWYTGWANSELKDQYDNTLFRNEDDVFYYFIEHFTDNGGTAPYGSKWFISGNYPQSNSENFSQLKENVSGGNFYPSVNAEEVCSEFITTGSSASNINLLATLLNSNYAISLVFNYYDQNGLDNGLHEVTAWGYIYDKSFLTTDQSYYQGLLISDSDNHGFDTIPDNNAPNTLTAVELTWDNDKKIYWLTSYDDNCYLYGFTSLAPFDWKYNPQDVARIRSFLEQTDSNGVKNANKLNYDSNDPTTWTNVEWTVNNGLKSIKDIFWYKYNLVGELDLSGCTSLENLYCNNNKLTSLNVSGCTALEQLYCDHNQLLTSLNVSGCTSLKELMCYSNSLISLDVSGCTSLPELFVEANASLSNLNISGCTSLTTLSLKNSTEHLLSFNASGCTSLIQLELCDTPLVSLNVSGCTALESLSCYNNQLTSLNVLGCTSLHTLECYKNQLTSLNVTECTALKILDCYNNRLTSLNVSNNKVLEYLLCFSNNLTSLNVTNNTSLFSLDCSNNYLTSLDVSNNIALWMLHCEFNQLTTLDVSKNGLLVFLYCWNSNFKRVTFNSASEGIYFGFPNQSKWRFYDASDKYCGHNDTTLFYQSSNSISTPIHGKSYQNYEVIQTISFVGVYSTIQPIKLPPPSLSVQVTGPNSVSVSFCHCQDAEEYTVEYSKDSQFSNRKSKSGTNYYIFIDDLEANTKYYFRVKAIGAGIYHDSDYSEIKSITTKTQLLIPSLNAAVIDSNAISVTVGSVEDASKYLLEYSTDSNFNSLKSKYVPAGALTLRRLKPDTTYYFRVRAISSGEYNNSDYSNTVSATTKKNDKELSTPSLNITVTGSNSVSVTVGSVANAIGYTVQYSKSPNFSNPEYKTVSAGSSPITGLEVNTTYYFRVKAVSSEEYFDSDYSETQSAKTKIRLTIPSLEVTATGSDSISVSVGSVENASSYLLLYSTNPNFTNVSPVTVSAGSNPINDLLQNTRYYFRVKAVGYGNYSDSEYSIIHDAITYDVVVSSEVTHLRAFLELTDSNGVKNGAKINNNYNANDVSTWGVTWSGEHVTRIDWSGKSLVGRLDLSECTTLTELYCNDNQLTSLDVSGCASLKTLSCWNSTLNNVILPSVRSERLSILTKSVWTFNDVNYNTLGMSIVYSDEYYSYTLNPGAALPVYATDESGAQTIAFSIVKIEPLTTPSLSVTVTGSNSVSVTVGSVANASEYTVQYSKDPNFSNPQHKTVSAGSSPISGLDANTTYYFRVKANRTVYYSDSDYSSTSTAKTNAAGIKLSTPSLGVTVTGTDSVSVTVSSVANASGYTVQYSKDPNFSNPQYKTVSAGSSPISGLDANTTYYFRVKANGTGNYSDSDYSSTNTAKTNAPGIKLSTPSLSVTVTGSNSVSVNVGSVDKAAGYRIEYSTDSNFASPFTQEASAGSNPISNLTANTKYYFRVKAVGTGSYSDSDYSASKPATTSKIKLSTPSLDVTIYNSNSVTVKVGSVSNATGYLLQYSTNSSFSNPTEVGLNANESSKLISSLSANITYYFRVKSTGSGSYSDSNYSSSKSVIVSYNSVSHDDNCLRAFLEQTDSKGVKNGVKLNSAYKANDPSTWSGITRSQINGAVRVTSINWLSKDLVGTLDLSGCSSLTSLMCTSGSLTSLNVSGCAALTTLWCYSNQLTQLNLSGCTALTTLSCSSNQLIELDVSSNTALKSLNCDSNKITSLNLSNNAALSSVGCWSSTLKTVIFSPDASYLDIYLADSESSWKLQDATGKSLSTNAKEYIYRAGSTDAMPIKAINTRISQTILLTNIVPRPLTVPTLSVNAAGFNSVTVNVGSSANASGYRLQYSNDINFSNPTSVIVPAGSSTIRWLNSNTTYYFRVQATGAGNFSDSSFSEAQAATTDELDGLLVTINGKKVTVEWADANPTPDLIRYRVAGTTRWTVKKLNAGITEMSFNATIGANYEIEVLLDQQENNVLQGSAIVLDQPRLTSIRNELKDDTFQVNVTNYAAKNLAANAKQALIIVNGVQTTLDIVNQQGASALENGGHVEFSNGSFTFTEMSSNTQYKIQVSFSDGVSVSTISSALSVKTTKTCYLAPVITSASAVSDASITVTWETAYGKKSSTPAQKYTVQYSIDGVKWSNATTGATGNSYTIQRLKGGVEYQVRVLATKDAAFEASAPSGVLSAQTLTLPKTTLDRTSIKDDTFKLNVTNYATSNLVNAPTLNVKSDKFGETAIAIQNGSGSATFENGMVAAFENGALTFTNVPSNTQQKIQVNFNDGVCTTAWTAALTVKTTIAPYNKPVLTNATAVDSTTVLVEWDAVTGKNSTVLAPSYTVQYTTDGTRWINANTRVVGTSFTIPNLKPNTSYRVAVIANKDARFNASQPSESWEVRTL